MIYKMLIQSRRLGFKVEKTQKLAKYGNKNLEKFLALWQVIVLTKCKIILPSVAFCECLWQFRRQFRSDGLHSRITFNTFHHFFIGRGRGHPILNVIHAFGRLFDRNEIEKCSSAARKRMPDYRAKIDLT